MIKKILYTLILVIVVLMCGNVKVQGKNSNQDIYRYVTDVEQEDGSHKINYRIYNPSRKV